MTFDPGPLDAVQGESEGDRWTLVFVKDLRHQMEKVWAALTDPERVARWAPFECDRDLGTGTRLELRHTVADREWLPKVAAGWHLCLLVAARLLDGDPVPVIRGRTAYGYGFDELQDGYSRDLGVPVR